MCTTGKYKERGIVGLQGFMSEYFSEKASNLVVVPSKLQKDAVLIEPTTVGIKSIYAGYEIQKARLYGGQNKTVNEIFKNILVIGGGSIGLLSSFILASLNTNVTCIDVDDEKGVKAEIIRDMGGQYLNLNEFKTESGINHSVFQSKSHKANFDLIIDASGNPDICFCFIDYLRPNSMLILLGLPGDRATVFSKYFDYSTFVLKNMIVLGSVNANKMHFEKTISHLMNLDSKYLNILNKIITHKLHYEQFEEAFALKTNERIKVVLTW